jgi:hypothetical protein
VAFPEPIAAHGAQYHPTSSAFRSDASSINLSDRFSNIAFFLAKNKKSPANLTGLQVVVSI